ncbi:MAG: chalcone isomerase family protein [Pseudomonadota bacterium]
MLATTSILVSAPALSATLDVGGVKVEDSLSIYNNTLVLNGAGLVSSGKTPMYVAQIYAKQKFKTLEELFAVPGPKRLVLTVIKETDTGPIVKMFNRSVDETAGKSDRAKLIPGLMSIGEIFKANRTLKPGDVMTLDWVPISGMVIYLGGKLQGQPYREAELFKAAMGVWMGDFPADGKVKEALLGRI